MNNRFSEAIVKRAELLWKARESEAISVAIEDFHPIEVIDYLVEVKGMPWVRPSFFGVNPHPTTYAIRAGRLDLLMWLMDEKHQPLDVMEALLDAVVSSLKTDCFLFLMNRYPSLYSWEKLIDHIVQNTTRYYIYVPFFNKYVDILLFERNIEKYLATLNRQVFCEEAFDDDFRFYYTEQVEAAFKKARVLAKDNQPLLDLLVKYGGSTFNQAVRDSSVYDATVISRANHLSALHGKGKAVKVAIEKEDSLQVIKYLVEVTHCCLSARNKDDRKKYDWHVMHVAIVWARIDILTWLFEEKGFELAFNAEERLDLLRRALMERLPVLDSMLWLMKRYPDDCSGEKLNKLLDDCEPLSPKVIFEVRVRLLIEQEKFGEIEALCLGRLAVEDPTQEAARLVLAKLLLEAKLGFVGQNNPLVREGVLANEMYRAVQGYYFVRDVAGKEAKALKEKFSLVLSQGQAGGVEMWTPDAAQYFARFALYMRRPSDVAMNVIIRQSLPLDAAPLFQSLKRQRVGEAGSDNKVESVTVTTVTTNQAPSPANGIR